MSAAPVADSASRRTIGDILLAHGFVSEEALAEATAEQERTAQPLGQILVRQGVISRLDLASALAEQWSDPDASVTPLPHAAAGSRGSALEAGGTPAGPTLVPAAERFEFHEISDRVAALAEALEASVAKLQHLEADVSALADVASHPIEPDSPDPRFLERLEEMGATISVLAERPTSDVEARGAIEDLAARLEALVDRPALDELRGEVRELQERPSGDPDLETRLSRLESGLAERLEATPSVAMVETVASRIEELAARVDHVAATSFEPDALVARLGQLESYLAERLEATASVAMVETVAGRIEDLSARLDHVAATSFEPDAVVARLDELQLGLEAMVDDRRALAEVGAAVATYADRASNGEAAVVGLAQRLEAIEQAPMPETGTRIDAAVLAALQEDLMESLRAELAEHSAGGAPADVPWADEAARLGDRLDELTATVALVGRASDEPRAPGAAEEDTELELERLRMAIERMSMHLGEQERALAEVMRTRDVTARLDSLEVRLDDVETAPSAGGANGGTPGGGSKETRALARRLDAAEAQLEEEREKMFTKMERIASAIAWRLQRLEAIPQATLDSE